MKFNNIKAVLGAILVAALAGCSKSSPAPPPATYTVGVTVTNLISGRTLVLDDNGADALTVTANGSPTFATALAANAAYAVTVATQPSGQTCTVTDGTGTIAAANVSNVTVNCTANTYTVGGSITNLTGTILLSDGAGASLSVPANVPPTNNTSFVFATEVASGSAYAVTITTQPTGQTCSVASGSGTIVAANISNVAISCVTNTYTVGGSISGLNVTGLVLDDNGGNPNSPPTGAATFTFSAPLDTGAEYAVTVATQPPGETCVVANGSGTIGSAIINNVAVTCTTNTYSLGGTVSGLTASGLTLENNGGSALVVLGNATNFQFPNPIASGTAYAVSISTQPTGETCVLANATGTITTSAVTNVSVTCTPVATPKYSVSGTISGQTGALTIDDNGGNATPVGSSATGFSFSTELPSGAAYAVTVATPPAGQTCAVTNGSGTIASANVTTVVIACSNNAAQDYSVGGTLAGLTGAGNGLVLNDNGGDALTLTANGSFTFPTSLPTAAAYGVSVATQPTGENCSVTNDSGTIGTSNVTNVAVSCAAASPPPAGAAPTATFSSSQGDAVGLAALVRPGANALVQAFTLDGTTLGGIPLSVRDASAEAKLQLRPDVTLPAQVKNCAVGGTATITATEANPIAGPAPGDTAQIVFASCSQVAQESVSGTVVITITSADSSTQTYVGNAVATDLTETVGSAVFGPYSFTAIVTYTAGVYTVGDYTINGFTIVSSPTIVDSGLITTITTGAVEMDYASGFVNVVYSNWAYNIMTGVPTSGTVNITGANGDSAVITVVAGGYSVAITISGTTTSFTVPF